MISAWWLVLTFVAGGYVGLVLCAMLSVSRDASDEARPLVVRRRSGPGRAIKEGA